MTFKSKLFLIKFEDDRLEIVNVKVKALSHKKKKDTIMHWKLLRF